MNKALYNLIRPHYRTLRGYVSAGMEMAKSPDRIFMNANENPFELPGLEGLNRYPAPQPPELAEAYARAYGVDGDQVVMTRGADEAIVILTKLFCEPAGETDGQGAQGYNRGDSILICPPAFGMYGVNASAMPARTFEVPLRRENGTFALDISAIIKAATNPANRVKLIYICSPNNPTGGSFSHDDIAQICEAVEDFSIVVLDETYAEFSAQGSMAGDLESTPNLIILRTLSKSYAFAGMRMGCFLCGDREFVRLVKAKCLDAYPLPQLSIEAAFHVLSPEISAIAADNIRKLLAERDRLKEALEASPQVAHVFPSDANFLLVEMKDAKGFHKFCEDDGVILRDFSSKPGTENCLRISAGTPEQNDRLLALLKDFSAGR